MIKVGIIGCGTIGSKLAEHVDAKLKGKAQLIALSDIEEKSANALSAKLGSKPKVLNASGLIAAVDLVIEAASAKVSGGIAAEAVEAGKDIMVMSSGGLLKTYRSLFELSKKKNTHIYLPSGAICGLDGLKGARASEIKSATLTTTKPPDGLKGAPYIVKNGIDLGKISKETVVFEGDALEAMEGFPANINVAATLSMCGIGPEKTKVKIIASPGSNRNVHEIEVDGSFGRLTARTENVPSPDNPKTSYMAVLSAIATLDGIFENVKIGT